jgi:hypothetical protein
VVSDPFAPPPAGWVRPEPPRRQGVVGPAVVAVGASLSLVLGLVGAAYLRSGSGGSPERAVEHWLDAARDGDEDGVREAVAPSQRDLVDQAYVEALPGLDDLELGRTVPLGLSADEALVEAGSGCAAVATRTCVVGSGPEGRVLAVREEDRWWVTARPLRVRLGTSPRGATPKAVVTRRLVLTGGLTLDQSVEEEVDGQTCQSLGAEAFEFRGDISTRGPVVTLRVGADPLAAPTGETRGPDDGLAVSALDSGLPSWRPAGEVRLRRAADGTSGELRLERWVDEPFFDQPVLPPVSGLLTWTCRPAR